MLLVNEEWKGAAHIYERAGFKTVNVFEDFFPKTDGIRSKGILMCKELF